MSNKGEKKNIAKGDSYKLAYEMIKDSIRHAFPLQAIACEESIISDRLWRTLNIGRTHGEKHETMGKALQKWKDLRAKGASPFDDEMEMFYTELSRWWDIRNKTIHGIVKSFHGEAPVIRADKFDRSAMKAAVKGKELADKIVSWSHKQMRKEIVI